MENREKRTSRNPQPPRAGLWVIVAMAAVICTLVLLHLAVQRERAAAAAGEVDFQPLSGVSVIAATPASK